MKNIDYDFLSKLQLPGQLAASPDKTSLAFILSQASFADNDYKSNLWLLREGVLRQLTFDGKVQSFSWEDTEHILFQAQRSKAEKEEAEKGLAASHFYRLSLEGGEAALAFSLPFAVSALEYLGQGFYLLQAEFERDLPNSYILPLERRKKLASEEQENKYVSHLREIPFYFNGSDYIDGKREGLFLYYAPLSQIERISKETLSVNLYRLSEDKTRLYYTANSRENRADFTSSLFYSELPVLRPLKPEEAMPVIKSRELVPAGHYDFQDVWEAEPAKGRDSRVFALASEMREYGLNESCKLYALGGKEQGLIDVSETSFETYTSINTDVDYGARPGSVLLEGHYYYLATERDHDALYVIRPDGSRHKLFAADNMLALAAYGRGFAVWGLVDMLPAELYFISRGEDGYRLEPLSNFNTPLFRDYKLIRPTRMPVKGTDQETPELDGWVIYPDGFEPGRSYPAILDVHGGPRTAYGPVFFHEMQVWAQKGYFVLFCNPRGSSGRGDDFADIRGKYGSIDYEDLMRFLDSCLEKIPEIDDRRLGVTGGSYGGFMSNWIIGHTDRFRACATQRSISNWISFYGTSDIGYVFACDQANSWTWDQAGFLRLWEFSPLRYINGCKTPTLIIHSDKDYRCPLEQGYQLFTALKDREVDAEMLVFHDETHELSRSGKPLARRRRLKAITDWMARYLVAETTAEEVPETPEMIQQDADREMEKTMAKSRETKREGRSED